MMSMEMPDAVARVTQSWMMTAALALSGCCQIWRRFSFG